MPTKGQKIRLAVFVTVSLAAIIAFVAIFTSQKFLTENDIYMIAFRHISVSGLEIGSPVKYLGIKVGTVDDISIDRADVGRIIVKVALKPGTPIKKDSRADIAAVGITGLKTIEIRGGSNETRLLKPGEFIPAGTSITEEITGKAEVIAAKLEVVLNNLQSFTQPEKLDHFVSLAEQASLTFKNANEVLHQNRADLQETMGDSRRIIARLDTTSQILLVMVSELQHIVLSDTVKQILANTQAISSKLKEADLITLIAELRTVADETNQLLRVMNHGLVRGGEDFIGSMKKIRLAADYLEETSRILQEDPSVLVRGTKIKDAPDDFLDR